MHHEFHNPLVLDRRSRLYAVVLLLPEFLDTMVKDVRERYDPDYNIIDTHLTLVFPFDSERSVDEIAADISSVTDTQSPFDVVLDDLADFYPESPVIYWCTRENEHLQRIYGDLTEKLNPPVPESPFVPHVTLAREISNFRVMLVKEEICRYIDCEKFTAESIDLMTPLTGSRWVSVRTFPLRGQ